MYTAGQCSCAVVSPLDIGYGYSNYNIHMVQTKIFENYSVSFGIYFWGGGGGGNSGDGILSINLKWLFYRFPETKHTRYCQSDLYSKNINEII